MNSNDVSESTRRLAKVMYEDLTKNRYGVIGELMFYNLVQMGPGNRYVSLHPIYLPATALGPRISSVHQRPE